MKEGPPKNGNGDADANYGKPSREGRGKKRRDRKERNAATIIAESQSEEVITLSANALSPDSVAFLKNIPSGIDFDALDPPPFTINALKEAGLRIGEMGYNRDGKNFLVVTDGEGVTKTFLHSEAVQWLQDVVIAYEEDAEILRRKEIELAALQSENTHGKEPATPEDLGAPTPDTVALAPAPAVEVSPSVDIPVPVGGESEVFVPAVVSEQALKGDVTKGAEEPPEQLTEANEARYTEFNIDVRPPEPPLKKEYPILNNVVEGMERPPNPPRVMDATYPEPNTSMPVRKTQSGKYDSPVLQGDTEEAKAYSAQKNGKKHEPKRLTYEQEILPPSDEIARELAERSLRLKATDVADAEIRERKEKKKSPSALASAPRKPEVVPILTDVPSEEEVSSATNFAPKAPRLDAAVLKDKLTEVDILLPDIKELLAEKDVPSVDEIADLYLRYQDAPISEEAKKSQFEVGELDESRAKYAQALQIMMRERSPEIVVSNAEMMRDELLAILGRMNFTHTPYARSVTWALWDMGKQYHYFTHPDEADKRYTIANPLDSSEKRDEILHRHLGWEFHAAYIKKRLSQELLGLIDTHPEIKELISKEVKTNNSLSSLDLAELGKLTHKAFAEVADAEVDTDEQHPPEVPAPRENFTTRAPSEIRKEIVELEKIRAEKKSLDALAKLLDKRYPEFDEDEQYTRLRGGARAIQISTWIENKLNGLKEELTASSAERMPIFDERFEKEFGISREAFEMIEGSEKLSKEQQMLVYENLKEYAERGHEGMLGSVWMGIKKAFGNEGDKVPKKGSKGMDAYGDALRILVYNAAIYGPKVHMEDGVLMPDLVGMNFSRERRKEQKEAVDELNRTAHMFARIPGSWQEDGNGVHAKDEWKVTTFLKEKVIGSESRKHYLEYEKKQQAFDEAKKNFAIELEKTGVPRDDIVNKLIEIDTQVYRIRFVETNPEAVEAIGNIKDETMWNKVSGKIVRGSFYAGVGIVGRLATTSMVGVIGGPLVSATLAGIRGWNATAAEQREKDRKTLMGQTESTLAKDEKYILLLKEMNDAISLDPNQDPRYKSKYHRDPQTLRKIKAFNDYVVESNTRLNTVSAKQEVKTTEGNKDMGVSAKLSRLTEAFMALPVKEESEYTEAEKNARTKLFNQLQSRVTYTQDKFNLGRIQFGDKDSYATNQAEFLQILGKAQLVLANEKGIAWEQSNIETRRETTGEALPDKEKRETLSYRLDRYLGYRESAINKRRHSQQTKKAIEKAIIAGGISYIAGFTIRTGIDHSDVIKEKVVGVKNWFMNEPSVDTDVAEAPKKPPVPRPAPATPVRPTTPTVDRPGVKLDIPDEDEFTPPELPNKGLKVPASLEETRPAPYMPPERVDDAPGARRVGEVVADSPEGIASRTTSVEDMKPVATQPPSGSRPDAGRSLSEAFQRSTEPLPISSLDEKRGRILQEFFIKNNLPRETWAGLRGLTPDVFIAETMEKGSPFRESKSIMDLSNVFREVAKPPYNVTPNNGESMTTFTNRVFTAISHVESRGQTPPGVEQFLKGTSISEAESSGKSPREIRREQRLQESGKKSLLDTTGGIKEPFAVKPINGTLGQLQDPRANIRTPRASVTESRTYRANKGQLDAWLRGEKGNVSQSGTGSEPVRTYPSTRTPNPERSVQENPRVEKEISKFLFGEKGAPQAVPAVGAETMPSPRMLSIGNKLEAVHPDPRFGKLNIDISSVVDKPATGGSLESRHYKVMVGKEELKVDSIERPRGTTDGRTYIKLRDYNSNVHEIIQPAPGSNLPTIYRTNGMEMELRPRLGETVGTRVPTPDVVTEPALKVERQDIPVPAVEANSMPSVYETSLEYIKPGKPEHFVLRHPTRGALNLEVRAIETSSGKIDYKFVMDGKELTVRDQVSMPNERKSFILLSKSPLGVEERFTFNQASLTGQIKGDRLWMEIDGKKIPVSRTGGVVPEASAPRAGSGVVESAKLGSSAEKPKYTFEQALAKNGMTKEAWEKQMAVLNKSLNEADRLMEELGNTGTGSGMTSAEQSVKIARLEALMKENERLTLELNNKVRPDGTASSLGSERVPKVPDSVALEVVKHAQMLETDYLKDYVPQEEWRRVRSIPARSFVIDSLRGGPEAEKSPALKGLAQIFQEAVKPPYNVLFDSNENTEAHTRRVFMAISQAAKSKQNTLIMKELLYPNH